MNSPDEPQPAPRADLISGGVWVVIGVAIATGSWRMDRLASQGVPGFAAPGLVPGVLGVLITLAALLIVLRSLARGALRAPDAALQGTAAAGAAAGAVAGAAAGAPDPSGKRSHNTRNQAAMTLFLCLGFAGGLVGHGLPFAAAAAIYLFLHIFLLQWPEHRAAGTVKRGALVAAAIAVSAGGIIATLFQYVFLVRLP